MSPPRLQCLNTAKRMSRKAPSLRAGFSTSQVVRADNGSNRSSTSDLLDSLGAPAPSRPVRSEGNNAPMRYQNIQLPTRQVDRTPSTSFGKRNLPTGKAGATQNALNLISKFGRRDREASAPSNETTEVVPSQPDTARVDTEAELKNNKLAGSVTKMITRRWKVGDVYAPHDMSPVEMEKWRRRSRPSVDAFDVLDMNPLDHYRNFSIMSEYMTEMGRIKHSKDTGLRPVNQRRIARAIRRSIGMGLMPSVHRHPEILQKMVERERYGATGRAGPSTVVGPV
ncbi:37S ribosomal protein rsm18 [Lachnellula suecica]|uniref:Small ribosomal subunit protein bS18m n=1 Tax=Lachnellula suecica TaxID=602035 RepID=A0A8T9CCJ8_9HELO|nr:37S ribosomal protein rsm18 [Lachnellula suecica]